MLPIRLFPSFPERVEPPAPVASIRACLHARRPDLAPGSATVRAAVLLLAAPDAGLNIDRVARRTGEPRHWVAACARRLLDNGVWAGGAPVYPWSGPDDFRFWNDVAVAEGRLLRRTGPAGRLEWAPPGAWSKAYDYVGPAGDPGGPVLYHAPGEETPEAEETAAPPPPAPVLAAEAWAPASPPVRAYAAAGAVPELFPGAAWLG